MLHKLFEYKDGFLYWKITRCSLALKGSKAGCLNGRNYYVVGIDRKKYLVHRIIWAMHGNEPVEVLDHVNGDTTDNRIQNLRAATFTSNMCNMKRSKRNFSGIKGVSWSRATGKWAGSVWYQRKLYKTPDFESKEECAKAVKKLRCELHGDFARHA